MAIGDTVNPGLMRTDFSVFQQAGLANAQANAAFGNAVGNFIDNFYKKKKEKEEKQERERFYRSQGFNPDEAKAASGDKDLANFLERKRIEDRNFEIAEKDFLLRRQDAELKRVADGRAGALFEEQLRGIDEARDEREGIKAANRLMMATPPVPPIEGMDLDGFINNLKANEGPLLPPRDSPAVAGLTGQFAEVGRRLQEGVESGEINADEAIKRIQGLQARQDALTPAPMTPQQALAAQKMFDDMRRDEAKEERDVRAEKRAESKFTDERKTKSFDGLLFEGEPLQGSIGDLVEAKKAKEGLANYNAIMRDLNDLKELGMKRENTSFFLSADDKKQASILANRVRGQIREAILGPGTVNKDEFERLAEQVPDPTDSNFGVITDWWSSEYGEEGVNLIEKLQTSLRLKVQDQFANYGVTFAPSGQATIPPSNNPIPTRDGGEVDFIDLSQ